MTSKLVVNTIEADTGISSVSFASSISMDSTSKFHFSAAGVDIGADTNINRPAAGVLGFNISGAEKLRIDTNGHLNTSGIVTAANFKSGVTNVHNLGVTLTGGQVDVGSNIKVGTAGVITATSFSGSGANLTGIVGGATGVDFNDNVKIRLGTGNDLEIFHTGTLTKVLNESSRLIISGSASDNIDIMHTQSEYMAKFIPNGAVELYHNNLKKFETTADGIKLGDAVKLSFNDYSYIWDNNTNNNTYWMNASNSTFIDVATGGKQIGLTAKGTAEAMVNCYADAQVELYHNGIKKLETASTGATVTGNLAFTSAGQGIDFGSSTHASGMTREILTDYEEGNWTPVFATAASGGSTLSNPSNTQGTYVKVGRIVYLHLGVHGLTKNWAGSNTSVYIRGIPYRSYFNHSGHCIRGGYWGANDDDMNLYAQIHNYQTYISIQKGGGAQGRYEDLHWDDMHWEGYGNLTLEMTYETDQGT